MLTHQATHPRSSGLGPGRGPHAGGGAGELPAGRWQCDDSGSAASLYGRGGGAGGRVSSDSWTRICLQTKEWALGPILFSAKTALICYLFNSNWRFIRKR